MEEMSEGRRALLAVSISLLILLLWSRFYKTPAPPPQKAKVPAPNTITAPQTSEEAPSTPATAAASKARPASAVQATEEQTIVVDGPLYRVELSNRGGVVRSWKLKKYLDDSKPPRPLDLVNAAAAQQLGGWPFSFVLDDPQLEAQVNGALFVVSPDDADQRIPAEVSFHWSDGHLDVMKKLKFDASYETNVQVTATLDGKPLPAALAWRGGFGDINVYQAAQLVTVYYHTGGKLNLLPYKKLGASGHPEQRTLQPELMDYAGIEDQFFTAAFLANGPGLSLWHWVQQRDITEGGKAAQEPVEEMAAGSAAGLLDLRVYVGPKDLDSLAKVRPPLEELVQFGWMGIIAKPLLFVLRWTYHYLPNYGWCIVLLTLAINTALFPLKMSSWRSMQRMQRVGPEIRSIQDRYKKYSFNDPRKKKMNEEVMAIYNREGINPMGSCLPMLLQMPIWWALYRMLQGAIELRHAPWFGWLRDLSARDPYYILPILMVVTMYLMQKMTPATTVDPAQQKMMTLMPLMFGLFFFRLSSGLVLYIFTSNLVGIAQQYYLNRNQPLPAKGNAKNKRKTG
jgi:YidC/Oxa1 family membrane protein insertase